MKDQETRERFIELRARGLSFDKISKELRTSKQTLINWGKELQEKIANLKAIELETPQEKYCLSKEKRTELFGEKLKVLKEELDKRDLSELSTKELFDLLVKYHAIIKKEDINPSFMSKREIEKERATRKTLEDSTSLLL